MWVISYCPNNTQLTPVWTDNGLSICLYMTVQPIVVCVVPLIIAISQKVHHTLTVRRCKRIEKVGLLQNQADDEDIEQHCKAFKQKNFRGFSFSKLPLPFFYALQIFLHVLHVLLPACEVILKLVLDRNHVAGVDILTAVLNILGWVLGLHVFKKERWLYFITRVRRHSPPMLLFWGVALILELLVLVSWNSAAWYLQFHAHTARYVSLVMFALRLTFSTLLFALGFHAPGLKQPVSDSDKSQDKNSFLTDAWEKSKKLWPFVWPKHNWLRLRVLVCLILLTFGRVLNVFLPTQYKKIVNYFTEAGHNENPISMIVVYMAIMFLQGGGGIGSMGLLNNIRSFLWVRVQQFTSRSVQVQLFEHLHNLSLRWHLQRKTGEIIRMVDRGSSSIENLLSYILFQILPTIVDIVIAVVYFGMAFNGWFALIVFITMALYVVATILVTEWRNKYRRDLNDKDNATKAVAVDSLLNFETVKYYNNESFEVLRYDEKVKAYQDSQWWIQMSLNILNTSQNVIITGGMLVGMIYCGNLVAKDVLSVGDFVLFITYMRQLYMPLNFFGTYYRLIQTALIDMENMFDLLDEEIEISDDPDAATLNLKHGLVEFKDVQFSYDQRKPVLRGISFSVLPGQTIALVGPSGSGKSTIIRLLFRFYELVDGCIYIDGQDIRKVTQQSLRRSIGVVPQDTVLFNDTIRYNVRYGKLDTTDSQVVDAASSADIHKKIVTFPDQYDTMVGERGLKLSGGEKQRVAIARTMLKAPEIVLLDEATSALDTQTERNIQASLNRVCANKTSIVVAHRLSTIIGADQILVLKNGLIVERGRHHELLEKEGLYSEMWNQQLQEDSSSDLSQEESAEV